MSVRRLAEDQFQPAEFAFNADNLLWAEKTINKYPAGRQQSAVIPLLMRAQEQDGWVTRAAIEKVADMLDMPYIRVLEVATFYTQFQIKPVGTRAHIQVCGTTPCMLRGSEELMDVCRRKIHHDPQHCNESGTLSWEEVECQGACVNAPMVMIFKDAYEDLTPDRLAEIIDAFEAGKGDEITPGPQIDRHFSVPFGGLTTLIEEIVPDRSNLDKPVEVAAPAPVAPAPAPVVKPVEAAVSKPALDDPNRPASVEKPATPDDLKLIAGVGPVIEGTLHELGIFTFAQVASWNKDQISWVDSYLNFKGRIDRDEWIKQAQALATGGEAEYIRVFGKKPR